MDCQDNGEKSENQQEEEFEWLWVLYVCTTAKEITSYLSNVSLQIEEVGDVV